MNEKFLKPYDPAVAEERISKLWDDSGYFNPDNLPERHKEPWSMVLPPPNVTGILHAGHAMMLVIQDIMVRFERMRGRKTLWLPGTDHAAIATQSKVEGMIYKEEGKRRHDLGREELLKHVEKFAQESHDTIVSQVKAMGSSVDWSREAFTLDMARSRAVRTAFKKMYDDGIIYRGHRIVNWDVKGQTTISDDEIVYVEQKAKLYTFRYSADFPIPVSTTRPETKVGDVAVAVHPDDARYSKYVGKEYKAVFAGASVVIKVVADQAVDPEFGTGAVGVTPAHSTTDWEIAERHDLRRDLVVINEVGKMNENAGIVAGKKVADARTAVVEWLRAENLMEKGKEDGEDIMQNISTAERTGGIIEPLPKLQWFVDVNKKFKLAKTSETLKKAGVNEGDMVTLKELMLVAVGSGVIDIIPDRFEKVYKNWIENLRDWCISRQIWYGHRVPVWYRGEGDKQEIFCGVDVPKNDEKLGEWKQDEDTLDTWFSSGLWTFSTLGWPDDTSDFATYHPTNVLETGYDIIFFWVARMILMSTYLVGDVPFKTVYLHGLVLDGQGRKMSKSLGNILDPIDMKKKYGADALRMSLVVGTGPGNDSRISEDKIRGYRNFANKLWNISRFVLSSVDGSNGVPAVEYDQKFSEFSDADMKLVKERDLLFSEITKEMEEYKFYIVAEKLYHYAWHNFADIILEESKKVFLEGVSSAKISRQQFLLDTLHKMLIAFHPFIPFVTEEIWSYLPKSGEARLLMIEEWVA